MSPAVPVSTARVAWSPLELFAATVALLLPIAYTSVVEGVAWSPRVAILLLVIGVGLPVLVVQTRGARPWAARAALAFVVVGGASAAWSQNHTTAVFGLYNEGTGLLFMASLAGAWAIGRGVRPVARSLLERALITGILVDVGIAILSSVITLPQSLAVNLFDDGGREQALAGNPVHLAALAVLALALVAPRFGAAPLRWGGAVVAIAVAAQLSGTRGALVIMFAIALWAGHRLGVRRGIALGLLLVLGLAIGTAIGPSGKTATARTIGAEQDGGLATRPETWWSARHALLARPLLGIGPGQFRSATSPYRPIAIARVEGPDSLFTDAHNIVVEYATTTGLLGLAALVLWLAAAIVPGRGWLAVGALGVLAIHLFEPQSVVSTPLLFLALGASAACRVTAPKPTMHPTRRLLPLAIRSASIAVSLILAAVFMVGEFDLHRGQQELTVAPVSRANHILPAWPRTASLLAQAWLFRGITAHHDGADFQVSRSWRLVAVQRDDADPALWNDLAELDASDGDAKDASAEFMAALDRNPTSARAMIGLANLAESRCDASLEAYWHQRAVRVSPAGTVKATAPRGRAACGD